MKNIFKKLHIGTNHDHNRPNETPPSTASSLCASDHRAVQSSGASPSTSSPFSLPSPAAVQPSSASSLAASAAKRQDYYSSEEEYQVQLALAISASSKSDFCDDPEVRSAMMLRFGGHRADSARNDDGVAEALSRHYWGYNVLDYEQKVVDGFYDVYALYTDSAMQGKMPTLADLEAKPESSGFEVVMVDRKIDPTLEELLQVAHCIALDCPVTRVGILVQRLAELVTSHMGGPVKDASIVFAKWTERSTELRTTLHTSMLPLGSINIGLSRHRALLFKVLADNINMPCRLVKGSHYTGVEDDVVNIIKLEDEREFLVDLMADPGTLIPADISSANDTSFMFCNPKVLPSLPSTKETDLSYTRPMPSHGEGSSNPLIEVGSSLLNGKSYFDKSALSFSSNGDIGVGPSKMSSSWTPDQPGNIAQSSGASLYKGTHGVNVTGDRTRLNANVAPYGQNSHDDSQSLFADLNPFQIKGIAKTFVPSKTVANKAPELNSTRNNSISGRPPVPPPMWKNRYTYNEVPRNNNRDPNEYGPPKERNTQKLAQVTDSVLSSSAGELKRDEDLDTDCNRGNVEIYHNDMVDVVKAHENIESNRLDPRKCTHDRFMGKNLNLRDRQSHSLSVDSITKRVDQILDDVDVSESEIPWEDLDIGERIGLGSYGEVYRADWNGTEVAVKKFLEQDFSGDALNEFKREVRIMRKLRHPNVVHFIGAVTRPPNLSIITELLPRGSLFRILHHPNCKIDEKQRIKMALDVARGMNCLHTSIPTIVHRDLKSPNLLVDKNWNVKVCDFGMSRLKHNTFLSSKSTAGTPEWMAPEVLRNEPSNEKCDVYSFGVILWELATLKLPWSEMHPMQVVGAVGFQNRRLDITKDVDPIVAMIIWQCWQQDPNLRPSFAQLTEALKPLQRLVIPSYQDQPSSSMSQDISVNSTP